MSESARPAGAVPDRWRTTLLMVLAVSLVAVLVELVPGTWRFVVAWRDDAALRAIARPQFYLLTPLCLTAAEVVLAIGAVGALATGDGAPSRRWLLAAFAGYFLLQIVPRLVPLGWSYAFPPELAEKGKLVLATAAPLDAAASVLDLLPVLIAFTLGLQRAGAHQAKRFPGNAAGPVLVFAATVQLAIVVAVALAFVAPLRPDGWLVRGLALLAVFYALSAAAWALRDRLGTGRVVDVAMLVAVVLLQLPGWGCVLWGLEEVEIAGKHLLAIGGREGFVTPAELPHHAVHFVARTCTMALAGNDLIARLRAAAADHGQ